MILASLGTLLSCKNSSEQATLSGLYVNYAGAEYENTIVECSTGRVWNVAENAVLAEIRKIYEAAEHAEFGELYLELQGMLQEYDRDQFPQSHEFGEFVGIAILRVSSDLKVIDECRAEHLPEI